LAKGNGVGVCKRLGRCGEDLRGPYHPSRYFHHTQNSKNRSCELLQEAAGDLQEILQEVL